MPYRVWPGGWGADDGVGHGWKIAGCGGAVGHGDVWGGAQGCGAAAMRGAVVSGAALRHAHRSVSAGCVQHDSSLHSSGGGARSAHAHAPPAAEFLLGSALGTAQLIIS